MHWLRIRQLPYELWHAPTTSRCSNSKVAPLQSRIRQQTNNFGSFSKNSLIFVLIWRANLHVIHEYGNSYANSWFLFSNSYILYEVFFANSLKPPITFQKCKNSYKKCSMSYKKCTNLCIEPTNPYKSCSLMYFSHTLWYHQWLWQWHTVEHFYSNWLNFNVAQADKLVSKLDFEQRTEKDFNNSDDVVME